MTRSRFAYAPSLVLVLVVVLAPAAGAQTSGAEIHIEGAFRAEHQAGVGSGIGNGFENVTFVVENDAANPDTTLFKILGTDGRVLFRVDDDGHVFMPHLERSAYNDHFVQIEGGQLYRYTPILGLMNDVHPYQGNYDLLLKAELKTWNGIGDQADERGIGYIAEEIEALGLTDLLVYDEEGRPEGIAAPHISVFLTPIVQNHHARLAERETQLAVREAEIQALERTLAGLKARLETLETRHAQR